MLNTNLWSIAFHINKSIIAFIAFYNIIFILKIIEHLKLFLTKNGLN